MKWIPQSYYSKDLTNINMTSMTPVTGLYLPLLDTADEPHNSANQEYELTELTDHNRQPK